MALHSQYNPYLAGDGHGSGKLTRTDDDLALILVFVSQTTTNFSHQF
jgi:hypothetical protein